MASAVIFAAARDARPAVRHFTGRGGGAKMNKILQEIENPPAWQAHWFKRGMICAMDGARNSFELKNGNWPIDPLAIGCGGWDEQDRLYWVGIDMDVGHAAKDETRPPRKRLRRLPR